MAGATYALFALGFTLMFGVMRVINLTYGVYFSAGALGALALVRDAGLPIGLALPAAAALVGLAAIMLDGALLTRLRRTKAPELASLMVTLGATLFAYALAGAWLGSEIRRFPFPVVAALPVKTLILASTVVVVIALFALMRFTRLGLAIRALAQNEEAAALMGIHAAAVTSFVSFLSGALGALAGGLVGLQYNAIQPFMGEAMMLKGFAVIIIGGLGDIGGALIAGLLLGILEALTAGYLSSSLKDAVGFGLLLGTLWIRPVGLFGLAATRRA